MLHNLDNLATFLMVIDSKSFSAAARLMNQTPSSVSKKIARLEASLGVVLFERNTRQLKITDEGKAIVERVRTALSILEDVSDVANVGNNHLVGKIKITAPVMFGCKFVTKIISDFIQLYPSVNIELQLTDHVLDLYSNDLDLAIRFGSLTDSRLVAKPLATSQRILVASPSYLKANPINSITEIRNNNCLLFSYPGHVQRSWTLSNGKEERTISVSGNLHSDNSQALRTWCIEGLGVALRESWDVVDELRTGKLINIFPEWKEKNTIIHIVRARREPLPRRLRVFIDYLTKNRDIFN